MNRLVLQVGLLVLALAACEVETEPGTPSSPRYYSDAVTQEQFKNALAKAGIPYGLDYTDSREFVTWAKEHDAAVEKLLPGPLAGSRPHGSHTSFPNDALHEEFVDWLTKKGIANDTVTVDGKRYIIWHHEGHLVPEFFEQRKR
jgi:hypothetical protein